jgi:hypothetical protein
MLTSLQALEEADRISVVQTTESILVTCYAVGATENKPQAAYRCRLPPNTTRKGHLL